MSNALVSLVIGAGSTIADAILRRELESDQSRQLIAVSRQINHERCGDYDGRLLWLESDYSEASIKRVGRRLEQDAPAVDRIFICNGVLHEKGYQPEKRLEDLTLDALARVMTSNAFVPILWLQALKPLLRQCPGCVVTVFSARVGSIADNHKGGWYAYRASKAALNMFLKTAAIELNRRPQQARILAFHPGTTDTPLSGPFQQAVPAGKLFSADFVAERLLSIIAELPEQPAIHFLDWDGQAVSW